MSQKKIMIPTALVAEIERRASNGEMPPQPLTAEDRIAELADIDPPFRDEFEQTVWSEIVRRNEMAIQDFLRRTLKVHQALRDERIEQAGRVKCGDDPAPQRQYLTVPQLADRWQVEERTIWRYLRKGRIRSFKIGKARRVLESDVITYEDAAMTAVA